MHKFLLILILSSFAIADDMLTAIMSNVDKSDNRFVSQVLNNRPSLSVKQAGLIVASAKKASKEFKIPLSVILAIAYVESSYRLDAVNGASNDFGIMQINQWHVKRSGLDKQKLLTDMEYSFYHGVRIFSWFYRKYPLEEAIGRYNCGTRSTCYQWISVKKYVDKVRSAL